VLLLAVEQHPAMMADDYLMKPINPIDLVVKLRRML